MVREPGDAEPRSGEAKNVPLGWDRTLLGHVARIRYGLGQPPELDDQGIPLLRATNVKRGRLVAEGLLRVRREAVPASRNAFLHAGEIVVVRSGAYTGDVALVTPEWDGSVAGYDLVVSPGEGTDPGFLAFTLLGSAVQAYFRSQRDRSAQPHLNSEQLGRAALALPPIDEQRSIAGVLRAIQQAREAAEKVIDATRELKRSLMSHLFAYGPVSVEVAETVEMQETRIGPVPAQWSVVELSQLVTQAQYGLSLRGERTGAYPILRMNNLNGGRIDSRDLQYVNLDASTLGKFKLRSGDLLFNRTNSYDLVGKTALFDESGEWVYASYLIRVKVDPETVSPSFLNYYLNWEVSQARLRMLATRGVSQSNISATKLKTLGVILPPLQEQMRIVDRLRAVDAKIEGESRRWEALDQTFRATLGALIGGKRRVADLETAHG